MRKRKLILENEVEDAVYGLVTALKDYKLAWKINQVFKIELIRQPELRISFVNGPDIAVTNYEYRTETICFRLLRNRGLDDKVNFLIPELSRFDYFIMVSDQDTFMDEVSLLSNLQTIDGIDYALSIDTDKLKSKDNFIF
jgi:hypothetical protein